MTTKKCNMAYSINSGALIQVQLGLSIVEIYIDQHSKKHSKKIPILKFQKPCVQVIWPLRIFFGMLSSGVTHCALDFYEHFYVALDLI